MVKALPLICLFILSCSPSDQPRLRGERTFDTVTWDTAFSVGGQLQDTILLRPRLLAAHGKRFYVYDYGDSQLKSFAPDGALLWRFGVAGEGPGEFRNPFDLEIGPDGSVWVVDAGAGRLTVVSARGELEKLVPLHNQMIRDVILLREEVLATPVTQEDVAWVSVASEGEASARGRYPLEQLRNANPGVRWTVAAASGDGQTWAVAFPLGNTLLVYDGRELRCHGVLVEGNPLPVEQGSQQPTIWAAAVFFSDSAVMVLARGETENRLRMLDEYSASDCTYVRTLLLPGRVVAVGALGSLYILAHEDPAPGVIGVRAIRR